MPLLDKQQRPICKAIDLRLFAHIHNDVNIQGTLLQGSDFNTTVTYIIAVMEYLEKNKANIDSNKYQRIKAALDKTRLQFISLMEIEKGITEAIVQCKRNYKPLMESLHKNVVELILSKLKMNNEVLIPGGWAGAAGGTGHAMCYKLQKNADGSMTFLVYNTGAGIGYHRKKGKSAEKYTPVKAFHIPAPELGKEAEFTRFLFELIAPQVTPILNTPWGDSPEIGFDENRIYTETLGKIAFLKGREIDPKPFCQSQTQGQLAGTCAMRVLMPMLHQEMQGEAFQEFLYQLRLQSILDLFHTQTPASLTKPALQTELRWALEKFSRQTKKMMQRYSDGRGKENLELVTSLLAELDKHKIQAPTVPLKAAEIQHGEKDLHFAIGQGVTHPLNVGTAMRETQVPQALMSLKEAGNPLLALREAHRVLLENDKNQCTEMNLQEIEKFLLSFPIDEKEAQVFWQDLSQTQAKECLDLLQNIMRLYGKQCYLKGGILLPQTRILSYTALITASNIANLYFKEDKNFQYLPDILLAESPLDRERSSLITDPFSVSLDPKWDTQLHQIEKRIKELQRLQREQGKDYKEGSKEFYDIELFEKYPEAVSLLNQLGPVIAEDHFDNARIYLYQLASGKIQGDLADRTKKTLADLFADLDCCTQFDQIKHELMALSQGQFDHFKTINYQTPIPPLERLRNLSYKSCYHDRHLNWNNYDLKSRHEYSNGTTIDETPRPNAKEIYQIENPIMDQLFFGPKTEAGRHQYQVLITQSYAYESSDAVVFFEDFVRKAKVPDALKRELWIHSIPFTRLRLKHSRIIASFDFFDQNLEKLSQHDYQMLCLLNLFTPQLLTEQLTETPELANKLLALIEKIFKFHCKQDNMGSGGLFALKLGLTLKKYLKSHPNAKVFLPHILRLEKFSTNIQAHIEINHKKLTEKGQKENERLEALTRLGSLHNLNILELSGQVTETDKKITQEQIGSLLNSILFRSLGSAPRSKFNDALLEGEIDRALIQVSAQLKLRINDLDKSTFLPMLKQILDARLVGPLLKNADYQLELNYPLVRVVPKEPPEIVLDLTTGNVKKAGQVLRVIPIEFYTMDFIRFFGNQAFIGNVILNANNRVCEFNYQSKTFRTLLDDQGKIHIQMFHAAIGKWLELQDPRSFIENNRTLPRHFFENGNLLWLEVGQEQGNYYITDELLNFKTFIQRTGPAFTLVKALHPDSQETGYSLVNVHSGANNQAFQTAIQKFSLFENPQFIEIWQATPPSDKSSPLIIRLPRYGIEFETVISAAGDVEFVWKENPNYRLKTSSTTLTGLGQMENILILEGRRKEISEQLMLAPEQLFYTVPLPLSAEGERFGERGLVPGGVRHGEEQAYYELQLDTTHAVANEMTGKSIKDQFWKFTGTSGYHAIKIDSATGKVQPKTPSEALHLAYLFLSTRETAKALDMLQLCKKMGGLQGKRAEIEWVYNIVNEIPALLGKLSNSKARLNDPETLAVRMHALQLLLDYKKITLDRPLRLRQPVKEAEDSEDLVASGLAAQVTPLGNQKLMELQNQRLESFYQQDYLDVLGKEYRSYFKVLGNIPLEFRLSPETELSVIKKLTNDDLNTAHFEMTHALNVHVTELTLMDLRREQLILERKEAQEKTLSEEDIKQLLYIKTQLARAQPAEYRGQRLVSENVEIVPAQNYSLSSTDMSLLQGKGDSYLFPNRKKIPIAALSLSTTAEEFIFSFDTYYNLAKDIKENSESAQLARQQLLAYVEACLRMQLTSPRALSENFTKIAYLSSLLYYVLKYPGEGWPDYSFSFYTSLDSIFAQIKQKCQTLYEARGAEKPVLTLAVVRTKTSSKPSVYPVSLVLPTRVDAAVSAAAVAAAASGAAEASAPGATAAAAVPIAGVAAAAAVSDVATPLVLPILKISESPSISSFNLSQELRLLPLQKKIAEIEVKLTSDVPEFLKQREEATKSPFQQNERSTLAKDYAKGRQFNEIRAQKRQWFHTYLNKPKRITLLIDTLTKKTEAMALQLDHDRQQLEILANRALEGPEATLVTQLRLKGRELQLLKFPDLLYLYLEGDREVFKQKTLLDDKSIEELYQQIHLYLLTATAEQQRKRALKHLKAFQGKEASHPDYLTFLEKTGNELVKKRVYNAAENTEMLVFEYLSRDNEGNEGTLIREDQAKLIAAMSEKEGGKFKNKIFQLIMGGGKSKLLLPILALKKADGSNLSILEVPAALFETNVADLNNTTQKLFGKTAYPFIFHRETSCQSQNLAELLAKLQSIIKNRDYLITTAESVQALELKYFELIKCPPQEPKPEDPAKLKAWEQRWVEWRQQVTGLEKILTLFKTRGDVIIDEVDSVLDPKRELNFTLGAENAIPEARLQTFIDLFNLLSEVGFGEGDHSFTLFDVSNATQTLKSDAEWEMAMDKLAELMVRHPKGPLYALFNDKPHYIGIVIDYIRGKSEEIPKILFDVSGQESELKQLREALALSKAQLQFLPFVLKRNPNEHFGLPESGKALGHPEIAIPYIANNTPNERAQFGTLFETIFYTLRLQKKTDKTLAPATILALIQDYKKKANAEVSASLDTVAFEKTNSALKFKELTGKDLNTMHPEDKKEMEDLITTFSQNSKIRDHCLLHYVLSNVKESAAILRSDGVNHIAQYRSAQGFTGTPWNYRCYHESLDFDAEESLGIDGQTMDLLSQKQPQVQVLDQTDPSKVMAEIFHTHPRANDIHAFIDTGALFKGVKNKKVAEQFALFFANLVASPINHILYFNDENQLCALPIDHEHRNFGQPILIGSTDKDVITERTGSIPEQCFTYYDQRHTTGTDIVQPINGIGVLSLDKETLARDYLQGALRMRGLAASQNVYLLLPKMVAKSMPDILHWDAVQVQKFVLDNQAKRLSDLHFQAAIQKMNNLLREYFKNIIKAQANPIDKHNLYQLFTAPGMNVFEFSPPPSLFERYGSIERLRKVSEIMPEMMSVYLKKWEEIAATAKITLPPEDRSTLAQALEKIANKTIQNCLSLRKHIPQLGEDTAVELQTEAATTREQDLHREHERELEQERLRQLPKREPIRTSELQFSQPEALFEATLPRGLKHPLNSMLSNSRAKPNSLIFDDNIFVSNNYIATYNEQTDYMDQFRKPVNFYLVIQDPPPLSALKAIIITQEEVENLQALFKGRPLNEFQGKLWVISPNDTLIMGSSPTIEHPNFGRLREQIRYFNGDIDLLTKDIGQVDWLGTDTDDKLEYLEKVIFVNFPEKRSSLDILKTSLPFRKLHQALMQAIQDKDLARFHELMARVDQLPDQRSKQAILNTKNLAGFSPFTLAIQAQAFDILTEILQQPQMLPSIQEAGLRAYDLACQDPALFKMLSENAITAFDKQNTEFWFSLLERTILAQNNSSAQFLISEIYKLPPQQQIEIFNHKTRDGKSLVLLALLNNLAGIATLVFKQPAFTEQTDTLEYFNKSLKSHFKEKGKESIDDFEILLKTLREFPLDFQKSILNTSHTLEIRRRNESGSLFYGYGSSYGRSEYSTVEQTGSFPWIAIMQEFSERRQNALLALEATELHVDDELKFRQFFQVIQSIKRSGAQQQEANTRLLHHLLQRPGTYPSPNNAQAWVLFFRSILGGEKYYDHKPLNEGHIGSAILADCLNKSEIKMILEQAERLMDSKTKQEVLEALTLDFQDYRFNMTEVVTCLSGSPKTSTTFLMQKVKARDWNTLNDLLNQDIKFPDPLEIDDWRLLIKAGIDINHPASFKKIFEAFERISDAKIMGEILNGCGSNKTEEPLIFYLNRPPIFEMYRYAPQRQILPEVQAFFLKHPLINPFAEEPKKGSTLFHTAFRDSNQTMIELLLAHPQFNVNLQNKEGWTPFMFAVLSENLPLIQQLLDSGKVDLSIKTREGMDALGVIKMRAFGLNAQRVALRQTIRELLKKRSAEQAERDRRPEV